MHLNDEERAMLAGRHGEPRRLALDTSLRTGDTVTVIPHEGLVRVEPAQAESGVGAGRMEQ